MAEKYSFQSPYSYAADNPVRFIDVNGEAAGDPVGPGIPATLSGMGEINE